MKLGFTSYAYAWAIGIPGFPQPRTPMDVFSFLRRTAALKLQVAQAADNVLPAAEGTDLGWAREVGQEAQSLGLILEIGARGLTEASLDAQLRLLPVFGARLLRFVIDGPGHHPALPVVAEWIRGRAALLEREGLTLAIENHDRFRAAELAAFLDRIDSPAVGLCLDTANSLGAGEGLDTLLQVLARHTVNLHVKDVRIERFPHMLGFTVKGCAAGSGVIDFPSLFNGLADQTRCTHALVELWPEPGPEIDETVRREALWADESIQFLRSHFPQVFP
ncbi:sugar phosphate isomerase/epimerase family protein [Nibricoccus sp. IMCC34717]|uniref:sugar phosphate isomerase/epimerase family protein n=1 Tax=Nibricoccus sp. IMCC34717 TaxID=3034021 RepID=UPI00384B8137